MKRMRISPAMAVAILALFVATTTGTALAATGTLVNIADGTTAGNVAKVDSAGALKTSVAGTAVVKAATPNSFYVTGSAPNVNHTDGFGIVLETKATLALDRIHLAPLGDGNKAPWLSEVAYVPIPAGGTCAGSVAAAAREITFAALQTGDSHVDTFPTPITLKPLTSGGKWCLVFAAGQDNTTAATSLGIDVSGYVVSGTFTPAPPSRPRTDSQGLFSSLR